MEDCVFCKIVKGELPSVCVWEDDKYQEFFLAAKKVSKLLEKGLNVKRVAIVMEGLGVNHAHIKLYPVHGLEKKFKETWAKEKKFFEEYEGYISTQLRPE